MIIIIIIIIVIIIIIINTYRAPISILLFLPALKNKNAQKKITTTA